MTHLNLLQKSTQQEKPQLTRFKLEVLSVEDN